MATATKRRRPNSGRRRMFANNAASAQLLKIGRPLVIEAGRAPGFLPERASMKSTLSCCGDGGPGGGRRDRLGLVLARHLVERGRAAQPILQRQRRIVLGRPLVGGLHMRAEARQVEALGQLGSRALDFRRRCGGDDRRDDRRRHRRVGKGPDEGGFSLFGHVAGLGLDGHRRRAVPQARGPQPYSRFILPLRLLGLDPAASAAAQGKAGTGQRQEGEAAGTRGEHRLVHRDRVSAVAGAGSAGAATGATSGWTGSTGSAGVTSVGAMLGAAGAAATAGAALATRAGAGRERAAVVLAVVALRAAGFAAGAAASGSAAVGGSAVGAGASGSWPRPAPEWSRSPEQVSRDRLVRDLREQRRGRQSNDSGNRGHGGANFWSSLGHNKVNQRLAIMGALYDETSHPAVDGGIA